MIHHCITTLESKGGVQTYIRSLLDRQSDVSQEIINLLEVGSQSQFELLHLHDPQQLSGLTGLCPTVFTLHNHSTYCPSGTKYFSIAQTCCDRPMSYSGCTWGRLVEGCGSRRPQRILKNFQTSYQELAILKKTQIPIIAVSEYARQQLISQGISAKQVTTIYHGIAETITSSAPPTRSIHQEQRLLFVGRIVPEKGLVWLLKALAQASSSIQLDIAGEGWFEPQVKKLAKSLGVENRITWHGWCDRPTLNRLYQQSFAVVFPSLWPEPAGLITLEAYARSRPVIASNVGGIPEYMLPNQTGLLVPPNQPDVLAEAMTVLANDLNQTTYLAEQGYLHLQKYFTIEHHVKNLAHLYDCVIQEFHAKSSTVHSQ